MSSKTIGIKVPVLQEQQEKVKKLEGTDLDILNEDLDLKWQEPEQITVPMVKKEQNTTEPPIDPKVRIEQKIKDFEEYIKAADYMQDVVLKERLKNRVVRVPTKKDPSIREAIRRLFGVDSDQITYDMFKKCLEIRSQLAAEQRRTTYKANEGIKE